MRCSINGFFRCGIVQDSVWALILAISATGCSDQGAIQPGAGGTVSAARDAGNVRLIRDSNETVIGATKSGVENVAVLTNKINNRIFFMILSHLAVYDY